MEWRIFSLEILYPDQQETSSISLAERQNDHFPLFPPKNYRKKRNEIFWIGNDPHPPLRKFSENSSNMVQVVFPKLAEHGWSL